MNNSTAVEIRYAQPVKYLESYAIAVRAYQIKVERIASCWNANTTTVVDIVSSIHATCLDNIELSTYKRIPIVSSSTKIRPQCQELLATSEQSGRQTCHSKITSQSICSRPHSFARRGSKLSILENGHAFCATFCTSSFSKPRLCC